MYNEKAVKHYEEGRVLHQKGQLSGAERAYKKAIKINHDFFEAHNNLGNVLLDRERLKEAANAYRKALNLLPKHPMLLNNLGNALQLQGENEKAIGWFKKAISEDPNHADAHSNLGNALRDLEQPEEAVKSYQRALEINPELADTHNNLGGILIELEELDDAIRNFERAIEIDPDHADAYSGLGKALSDQGENEKAISTYYKAIEIDPRHKDAYYGLGRAFRDQSVTDGALAAFRKAIELDPTFASAYNGLGNTHRDRGEIDQAIATFHKAIEIDPALKGAYNGLAAALSDLGEIDDAIAMYRKAIEIDPEFAEAYRSLAKNKNFSEYDDDIRSMETLYMAEGTDDAIKKHLAFGLGKASEDLGEFEKSIEYIIEATRLHRASLDYSIIEDQQIFEKIKQAFSTEFFAERIDSGISDTTPIFILGMPRSGTSLVEQVLASHPDVYGAGELTDLIDSLKKISAAVPGAKYPDNLTEFDAAAFVDMGREYISRIRARSQTTQFITDKMPHNFLRIGLINVILPNAKIISCTRNPMDNCLSIFKNYFSSGHDYSYDMTELGQYYNLFLDLMEYWKDTLPGFIYDLNYERLVADQESEIRKLLEYCDLPWDDACLDFHKTQRRVGTASNAQVRKPIYKDSVKLWERYEKQLQPLQAAIEGS